MNCRVIFRGQTGEFFSKGELLPYLNGFLLNTRLTATGASCVLKEKPSGKREKAA